MLIIPAIDLKEGRCVRLWRGIRTRETVYSEDPLEVAERWTKKGAKRLHIVDLDGAFQGSLQHLEIAEKIKGLFGVTVQFGGGIRTEEALEEVMQRKIDFAIIGTAALSEKFLDNALKKFGKRIIVSVDCKNNKLALEGWEKEAETDVLEFTKNLTEKGIKTIILTDVLKDGTLEGVNIEFIRRVAENINSELIIAGGVGCLDDIRKIKELKIPTIKGVIIGKALYSGKVDLEDALNLAQEGKN